MEASEIDWVDASILDPDTILYNGVNTSEMLEKLKVSSVFQGLRGEVEASLPPAPAAPPPQSHGANEPQKPSMHSRKSDEQPKIKNEQPEPPATSISRFRMRQPLDWRGSCNTHQEISSQFGSAERHSDPQDHQASDQAAQQSSHQEAPRKPVNTEHTQSSHHANGHSKREAFKVQAAPVQRTVSKWEPHIVHSYVASDTNKEAEQLNLPPTWPPGQREEQDLMDTSDCQPVHDQSHSSDNPPDSAQHDPHPEQDDPMETEPKDLSQPPNDQPSASDAQDNLNSLQPQSVAPEGLPVPLPSGEPDEMKQE